MRNVTFLETAPIPTHNKVLVRVKDTYDEKKTASGIILSNAAHFESEADSPGFNLSEWIVRTGVVEKMPRILSLSNYDWYPNDEISVGDQVYWPIVRFFEYEVIKTDDGGLFMLVDYHDIHLKKVDGVAIPVNGFILFTQEKRTESALEYSVEKDEQWFDIVRIGQDIKYEYEPFNYEAEWEEGDRCILNVPPYKLEAETTREFDEQYFLAQKRHILMAI